MPMKRVAHLVSISIFLSALPASAQPSAPTSAASVEEGKRHFQAGVALFNKGDLVEALTEFEQSYRINPVPGVLNNIALTQKGLGRYRESIETFERYLSEASLRPVGLPPQRRADVEKMIAEMRTKLAKAGTAPVPATGTATGTATVPATGAATAPAPATGTATGTATVPATGAATATAPATATSTGTATTTDRATATVSAPIAPSSDTRSSFSQFAHTRRGAAAIAFGSLSVAALVATAATGGAALATRNDYDRGCDGGACDPLSYDRGRALAISSDVLLGVGLASAAVTTILVLTRPRTKPLAAAPLIGNQGAGLILGRSF